MLRCAAVDPHEHRQIVRRGLRRAVDLQIEAVLAHVRILIQPGVPEVLGPPALHVHHLHAHGVELRAIQHAFPRLGVNGRFPAQLAHRRGRVRHALVDDEIVGDLIAAYLAELRGDHDHVVVVLRQRRQPRKGCEAQDGGQQQAQLLHEKLPSGRMTRGPSPVCGTAPGKTGRGPCDHAGPPGLSRF